MVQYICTNVDMLPVQYGSGTPGTVLYSVDCTVHSGTVHCAVLLSVRYSSSGSAVLYYSNKYIVQSYRYSTAVLYTMNSTTCNQVAVYQEMLI
eukprot:COSAG02_NODE_2835_length_7924_cov_8.681534_3_plen_93_part_00